MKFFSIFKSAIPWAVLTVLFFLITYNFLFSSNKPIFFEIYEVHLSKEFFLLNGLLLLLFSTTISSLITGDKYEFKWLTFIIEAFILIAIGALFIFIGRLFFSSILITSKQTLLLLAFFWCCFALLFPCLRFIFYRIYLKNIWVSYAVQMVILVSLVLYAGYQMGDIYSSYISFEEKLEAYKLKTRTKIDPTQERKIILSLYGFDQPPIAVSTDRLGRIILTGPFSYYAGHSVLGLVRLDGDGRYDASFNPLKKFDRPYTITSLLLSPEGEVYVNTGIVSDIGITKIKPDSQIDLTYQNNMGKGTKSGVKFFSLQTDNQLLLSEVKQFDGHSTSCLVRLKAYGSLDQDFEKSVSALLNYKPGNCSTQKVYALKSGQILVKAMVSRQLFAGQPESTDIQETLLRLNNDGSLDKNFKLPSNRAIVDFYVSSNERNIFLLEGERGNETGKSMSTFTSDGIEVPSSRFDLSVFSHISHVQIQNDGKFLIAGELNKDHSLVKRGKLPAEGVLVRFLPNGMLDPDFLPHQSDYAISGSDIGILYIDKYSKILLAGMLKAQRKHRRNFFRLNSDGSVDESFGPG